MAHVMSPPSRNAGGSSHDGADADRRGTGILTRYRLPQANVYAMIEQWAAVVGIGTKRWRHSFRATEITAYLKNQETLVKAAQMGNHAGMRTTQLYDRRREELRLDEVERILV